MLEDGDINQQLRNIQNKFDVQQFNYNKKLQVQKEQLDTNTQKIKELEDKINQILNDNISLKADNDKKQQEIDKLIMGQQKLTNDLKKIWTHLCSVIKTQRSDSQMISNLSINSEQGSQIKLNLPSQIKQIIQEEIQNKFLLIQDNCLNKSEFFNFKIKIEDELGTLKQKFSISDQQQFQTRRDSNQLNQRSQFLFPPSSNQEFSTLKQSQEKNTQVSTLKEHK